MRANLWCCAASGNQLKAKRWGQGANIYREREGEARAKIIIKAKIMVRDEEVALHTAPVSDSITGSLDHWAEF